MAPLPKPQTFTSFDVEGIRQHVAMLHDLAEGVDGVLVVSVFYASTVGTKDSPGSVSHHRVGDVDGMVDAIVCHDGTPGANVYAGLQVMRRGLSRGSRGTEADIVAVLGLVADMDADTGRASGEYPCDPSYILETSPGNLQPCWLFDRPLAREEAKHLAASLKAATGSDYGTGDVTHVWRIPGTLNWPNEKKIDRGRAQEPASVRLLAPWDGTLQDADEFREKLPQARVADVAGVKVGELPDAASLDVSSRLQELLDASDVGDRSAHAARIVELMGFERYSAEEAAALFMGASGNWRGRYTNAARAMKDFERMWSKDQARRNSERDDAGRVASNLSATAKKPATVAANDNKRELNIFEWRASRFAGDPEPVEYLIEGVIESGIPGMVGAMGEVGKSFALLELSRRVAFGSSKLSSTIFGGHVAQEGTAVFITGEDDARSVHRRIASLDQKGARYSEKGDKLIVVPLPSTAAGIRPFWKDDRKLGMVETDDWKRLCDQLSSISDLRCVSIDPLQLFAHVALNEDPAAGQFVCGSIAQLAVATGANIFFAHHMKKGGGIKGITTLADARESIRGTTAIVDGVRVAYAFWYPEKDAAVKICKSLGIDYAPNRIVHGGVVKANGAANRILSTYARNEFGLIVDRTSSVSGDAVSQDDLRIALVLAIGSAAGAGRPFKQTGTAGLYVNRERLPEELRRLSRHRLEGLSSAALERGEIVRASAKGEKSPSWLDVPTGVFALGLGTFSAGADRH